jgi:hypothetical protein
MKRPYALATFHRIYRDHCPRHFIIMSRHFGRAGSFSSRRAAELPQRVFFDKSDPEVEPIDRQIIGRGFQAPIANLLATGSRHAKNA